jgi:AcrR family transcriptional regulator
MTGMTEALATDTRDDGPGPRRSASATGRRLSAGERRDQLFDVALSLFAERGYAATTMDDIAEAAGVTKPLVYQHFDSKLALYLELMEFVSRKVIDAIASSIAQADGPRQQVELGFAAYFELVVWNEDAFRLLYGRDAPDDPELGDALRRVEDAIAEAIDPLIDAGLDPEHRLLLAYAVVGMAEGASRHWMAGRGARDRAADDADPEGTAQDGTEHRAATSLDAGLLAIRLADLAWAGLRQVHRV